MKILSVKNADLRDASKVAEEKLEKKILRQVRQNLLNAFDVYKTNVSYGIIDETEDEKKTITAWYLSILDLEIEALEKIPQVVSRYLK